VAPPPSLCLSLLSASRATDGSSLAVDRETLKALRLFVASPPPIDRIILYYCILARSRMPMSSLKPPRNNRNGWQRRRRTCYAKSCRQRTVRCCLRHGNGREQLTPKLRITDRLTGVRQPACYNAVSRAITKGPYSSLEERLTLLYPHPYTSLRLVNHTNSFASICIRVSV